jgi:hypothetical protein
MTVRMDGSHELGECAPRVVVDAPGRIRMRELFPALETAHVGGVGQFEILVDTSAGLGSVPFPLSSLTRYLEAACRVEVGFDGELGPGLDAAAKLVVLRVRPDDALKDVVLTLLALGKAHPGPVVLELTDSH